MSLAAPEAGAQAVLGASCLGNAASGNFELGIAMQTTTPYTIVMYDMETTPATELPGSRKTINSQTYQIYNCHYRAYMDDHSLSDTAGVRYQTDHLYRIDMAPAVAGGTEARASFLYSFSHGCAPGARIFCEPGSGRSDDLVFFIDYDGIHTYPIRLSRANRTVDPSVEDLFGYEGYGTTADPPRPWVLPYDYQRLCSISPSSPCSSGSLPFLTRLRTDEALPDRLPVALRTAENGGWRVAAGTTLNWSSSDVSAVRFGAGSSLSVEGTLNASGIALTAADTVKGWRGLGVSGGTATFDGVQITGVSYDDGSVYKRANSAVNVTNGATLTLRGGSEVSGARMAQGVEATGATVVIEGSATKIESNAYAGVVAMPGARVTVRDQAQVIQNLGGGVVASGYDARVSLDHALVNLNTGVGVSATGGGTISTTSPGVVGLRTEVNQNQGGLDAASGGGVWMGSCGKRCLNTGHAITQNTALPGQTATFFDARSTGGSTVVAQQNDWAVGDVDCLVLPKDGSSTLVVAPILANGSGSCNASQGRGTGAPATTVERFATRSGAPAASRGGVESALAAVMAAEEALNDGDEAGAEALLVAALDDAETDDERAGVYGGATRILARTQPAGLVANVASRVTGIDRPFALRALAVAAASTDDPATADGYAASLATEYAGTDHEAGALAMRTRLAAAARDEASALAHLGTLWALAPTSAAFAEGAAVFAAAFPDADLDWAEGRQNAGKSGAGDTAVTTEPPVAVRLTVWPNPTTGAARVAVALEAGETLSVSLFDGLGRRVAVVAEGATASGGTFEVALPVASLPPGIYLVRVERRGTIGTVSVAVARLTVVR